MSERENISTFQSLADRLGAVSAEAGPAMAHGIFCGLLCGQAGSAEAIWIAELLPDYSDSDLLARETRASLMRLAADTRAQLDGVVPGIRPLLPDEESPLPDRVSALGEWCEGFLFGLGLTSPDLAGLSEEGREALRDLTSITHVDHRGEALEEADEDGFAEVSEFAWVAAMLIYSDLAGGRRHGG